MMIDLYFGEAGSFQHGFDFFRRIVLHETLGKTTFC